MNLTTSLEVEKRCVFAERQVSELKKEVNALQLRIQQKDIEIKKLRESFIVAKDEKNEIEESFMIFHQNKAEVEQTMKVMQKDKERLQMLLNEKTEMSERRIQDAIEIERQHAESELLRIQKRAKTESSQLEIQLKEKTEKLSILKKKYRDLAFTADEAMKKQRESINRLMKQNQSLSKQSQGQTNPMLSTQLEDLSKKLSKTIEEKNLLQLKITSNQNTIKWCSQMGKYFEDFGILRKQWDESSLMTAFEELKNKNTVDSSCWCKWASILLSHSGLNSSSMTHDEMMKAIGGFASAGLDKYKLVGTIQSLRTQKKILLNQVERKSLKLPVSMKQLILATIFFNSVKSRSTNSKKKDSFVKSKK